MLKVVTGATGFVGGHLLDRLDSSSVVGWYRRGGHAPDATRQARWTAVDLTDRDGVARAIGEVAPAQVFHIGGAASVETSFRNAVPHLRVNALGSHHLYEAVRRASAPCRVLAVTSAQIYRVADAPVDESAPIGASSPYGLSKLAADELACFAAAEGLDVVIARPFNHIGPRQAPGFAISSFARQVARFEAGLEPPVIKVGNLDSRRDITDVRDVVEAYLRLMADGRPGRPYNICSGRAYRIGDLLDQLIALARVPVRVEIDLARLRPIDDPIIVGNPDRLHADVGWTPTIPIEKTLQDTLDWWRHELSTNQSR